MRYRKGLISISDSRDIPLLLLIRDSRAITISQLISELTITGVETNPRSIHWRLGRLVEHGLVTRLAQGRAVGEPVVSITHDGLSLLEGRGHVLLALGSFSKAIVSEAEVPHMLELNAIRFSLRKSGLLIDWKSELQIVSENLIDYGRSTKDYDSMVVVRHNGRNVRFALEFERTAKSSARYREICQTIREDSETDLVIYLSVNQEIMYLLLQELRSLKDKVAFGVSSQFRMKQLAAPMIVIESTPIVKWLDDVLSELSALQSSVPNEREVLA